MNILGEGDGKSLNIKREENGKNLNKRGECDVKKLNIKREGDGKNINRRRRKWKELE